MKTFSAKNLTLREVRNILKFDRLPNGLFAPLLSLEPLSEFEQQELAQIRNDFAVYLAEGRVVEGLISTENVVVDLVLSNGHVIELSFIPK